ncbi:MAG: SURF1 family protein [Hyphomicrobiaceae bacterium]
MSGERAERGLLWPTVFMIVTLAVLLGLGTWQLQRKAWKDGLIAQIAARTTAPPIPLDAALARVAKGEDLEYARIRVRGRWLGSSEVHLWVASSAGPGWHVYAPLATGGHVLVVNRGFVPDARRDPATRPEPASPNATRDVELVGLLRKPEVKSYFTPDNNPTRNIWYWRDLDGMARAMRLEPGTLAPFFVDAEAAGSAPVPAPQGGVTRLDIPNSHLQYAVTWYGLAATLIGVYAALAWGRMRSGRGRAGSPPVR